MLNEMQHQQSALTTLKAQNAALQAREQLSIVVDRAHMIRRLPAARLQLIEQ
jgi:hypothetical protein